MQHSSASHCTSQKSNERLIRQMPRSLLNNISIKCHRSIYETTIKLSHSISPLPVNEIIAHLKTKPLAIHKWVSALHAFSVYPIPTAHRLHARSYVDVQFNSRYDDDDDGDEMLWSYAYGWRCIVIHIYYLCRFAIPLDQSKPIYFRMSTRSIKMERIHNMFGSDGRWMIADICRQRAWMNR